MKRIEQGKSKIAVGHDNRQFLYGVYYKVIVVCTISIIGCNHKETCELNYDNNVIAQTSPNVYFPRDVCRLLSKAVSESSTSTRIDLFGSSNDSANLHCNCEYTWKLKNFWD